MKQIIWYWRLSIPWTRWSLELCVRRSWSEAEVIAFQEQLRSQVPKP